MPRTRPQFRGIAAALIFFAAPVLPALGEAPFGTCNARTDAPPAVEAALDDLLALYVPGETPTGLGSAPGGVLSVKGPGWRYVKSIGTADPDTGAPIDCGMPFQIGSNTKMMTAVVLLQLQEEGRLSIDDLLSDHLPEVAEALPDGDEMTLRQLARHTSGVFSYTDNAPDGTPGLMEGAISDIDALRRGLAPDEMVDFVVAHGAPIFAPGQDGQWSYSNTGYTLLGMVIEKLERQPIDKSFETRIFGPLGMTGTYFWDGIPRPEFGLPRSWLAAPFDYETTDWNMSQGWAAGAVVSTAEDMHVFIEALVRGELFRSPETLALMKDTVPTTHPALLGYGIGLARKGDNLWGHGGQTLGFESDVAASVEYEYSLVGWATSSSNPMSLGANLISRALRDGGALPD